MKPSVLRNLLGFTLLLAIVLAMACQCFGQTDEVAVGVGWQVDGWTEVPYPPTNGDMFFVDADAANDSADGRMGWTLSISNGTYDHTGNGSGERLLTSTGAFSSYTHTGGDYTDVIYVTNVSGGIATGYYVIASKVSNDAVTLEAASGLTADGVCDASSGPKQTPSAGNALCSDDAGDRLLFQRGDTWTITADLTPCEGASASEPQVYGAYGSGARPKIIADGCQAFRSTGNLDHVYFLSLHLEADLTISEGLNGLDFVTMQDGDAFILIEDCKIDGFAVNVLLQATQGNIVENITIRRNAIINAKCGDGGHSQGIYAVRTDGVLVEENIFSHNGYTDDWEDTAVLASGTTAAYTNGDTLTVACVRYGAFTASGEGNNIDIELIDTNNASGTITSVTFVGDDIEVRADFTTGIASNTVATAIQAFNGGADFTCTSSGTADLVAADAGTQANVTSGGQSYDPTIFNHGIYWGNENYNVTFRGNAFAQNAHMAMKINNNSQAIIVHDNLITKSDRWGHIGNAAYSGGEFVGVHGSYLYVYNNVCLESTAIANATSNGPTYKNALGGYFRNNFIGQRDASQGTGADALKLTGPEDVDGGDYTGVNNSVFDSNVMWNFHGIVTMELGPNSGDDGRESNDNTWSNNIVGNTADDDQPLLDTELTDSGVMAYSGTNWWSTQSTATAWFDVNSVATSTTTWQSTYEATADFTNPTSGFTDPARTSTTFAVTEKGYADWDAWWSDVQDQRKGDYDTTIMAEAVNDYIRAGFDMSEYSPAATKKVLILQ